MLSIKVPSIAIASIDGDLFQNTKKIQEISFIRGQFRNVGENLLDGLNDLKIADFQWNPCVNFYANSPEKIQELKLLFMVPCPPATTAAATTEAECSVRCSLTREFDELRWKVEEQDRITSKFSVKLEIIKIVAIVMIISFVILIVVVLFMTILIKKKKS